MPENSVLIVEDDEIIARVLLSMLREGGFVIHTPVNSGEQVIEQVAIEKPDIVLMDIDLPGVMSGIEAASELFNIFSIPVIYVTGHDEKSVLERAISSMPFGFLIKPVHPNLLYSTIRVSISLCEQMRQTTEGKNAGLSPSMIGQLSGSQDPIFLINSEQKIIWMNQGAEEVFNNGCSGMFLKSFPDLLREFYAGGELPTGFFTSHDYSLPVKLSVPDGTKNATLTSRAIMNMFGRYAGSLITFYMHS